MPGTDRDLVSRLLRQSILALCREAVSYNSKLEVDGIVCVTLDNQTDHVVKIHELFSKPVQSNCTSSEADTSNADRLNSSTQQRQTVRIQQTTKLPVKYEPKVEPVITIRGTSPGTSRQSPSTTRSSPLGVDVKQEKPDEPTTLSLPLNPEPVRARTTATAGTIATASNTSSATALAKATATAKLEVSKARHIACKKCDAVMGDAKAFEQHNTDVHGHFTCMVCLATFTSRNNMKRHIRLHTGVKPYTCNQCSESFARNDDYKRHILRHSFEKPFRCAMCNSGYSDRACVKNHMIKEHGSKVFHICPQCGLSYSNAQKFQIHKKTHPEFQDYRCELCSFTGSNSLMYNKHMLTHGPSKRYKCGHCEVTFNDPFSYTNHMKRHKGDELVQTYICCFCEHVSQTYEQFQRHEHSHLASKQHTCSVCEKQFRYPSNLREHMLTHMPKLPSTETKPSADGIAKGKVFPLAIPSPPGFESVKQSEIPEKETNNNVAIQEDNNHDAMEEDSLTETGAGEDNGSDYWCTECNQGFGTEDLLQDHIINTHEDGSENPESPSEQSDAEFGQNVSDEHQHVDDISPYELNTQVDSPGGSLYDEDTCSTVIVESPIAKRMFSNKKTVYEEHTQLESQIPLGSQRNESPAILPPTKRLRAYDEETVTDGDTRYQDDIATEPDVPENHSPAFSSVEMAIVQDAMKEVQKIQSRFGIIQGAQLPGSASSVRSDSQLRHALKAGKANTGFIKPTAGIWKSPVSINRSRLWASPQHDINRNNIPSNQTVPKDLTSSGSMIVGDDDESNSSDAVYSSNTPTLDITGDSPHHYSKTSVLGMDTDFSTTPNRGSPTTLNLTMKSPGFEKVVTPSVLFKDRGPFTCNDCDQAFQEFEGPDGFDQHGISVHRRYICSWCGKPFTSRPNRERHVRYHTGEKPYKCDVCAASFFRGDDLKYHRTTKHSDIRPFHCATCKASFAIPKELEKHLRVYPDHRMTS